MSKAYLTKLLLQSTYLPIIWIVSLCETMIYNLHYLAHIYYNTFFLERSSLTTICDNLYILSIFLICITFYFSMSYNLYLFPSILTNLSMDQSFCLFFHSFIIFYLKNNILSVSFQMFYLFFFHICQHIN